MSREATISSFIMSVGPVARTVWYLPATSSYWVVSLFAMLVIGFLFRKHAVVVLMDFLAFSLLLLAVESFYIISLKKNMKK